MRSGRVRLSDSCSLASFSREVTLGDLLAQQDFDRGGQGGSHGTLAFLLLRRTSSNGPGSSCALLRQTRGRNFVRQMPNFISL